MKWYSQLFIAIIIISIVLGITWREAQLRKVPIDIRHYGKISKKIALPTEKLKLKMYVLFNDTVWVGNNTNLSWRHLLDYLHYKVRYTGGEITRHEDPIEILEYGKGRCGEFAIAYTALCLAFDVEARMVICLSDHVWSEVFLEDEGRWMHVEPTDKLWDDPYLYSRPRDQEGRGKDFGGKDKVYALENGKIEEITKNYIWEEEPTNPTNQIGKGDR